jgi:hypothetical protein
MGTCTAGTSTIVGEDRLEDSPTNAFVGVRWNSDGTIESYNSTTVDQWATKGPNGGPWIGSCPANKYEYRWTQLFDTVDNVSTPVDIWVDASTVELSVENQVTGIGIDESTVTFELRRASDQVVILTDTFFLDAEVEDPTPK